MKNMTKTTDFVTKTLKKTSIATVAMAATLIASLSFAQQEMVQTDLAQVYGTGETTSVLAPQVKIKPGVYAVGDDNNKLHGTHYLIVDQYINDSDKALALFVNQDELREKYQATGKLYISEPLDDGSTLMFSPIEIGTNGQLTIHSDVDGTGKSPVLTVSQDPQAHKLNYPYIIQGHNGALNGQLLGMRAKSGQNPTFRPWPSHSIFNAETTGGKLLVQGKTLSIHEPNMLEKKYQLLPINGVYGKMAALVSTSLNTMERAYHSKSAVKELAFFLNLDDCEVFIIATPSPRMPGEYVFKMYGPRNRTFLDFFRKGKLEP